MLLDLMSRGFDLKSCWYCYRKNDEFLTLVFIFVAIWIVTIFLQSDFFALGVVHALYKTVKIREN